MFISVDLPEPDWPITATNSPASTVSEIPLSTGTFISPIRYVLLTFSRVTIGGAIDSLSQFRRQAPSRIPPGAIRAVVDHDLVAILHVAFGDLRDLAIRDPGLDQAAHRRPVHQEIDGTKAAGRTRSCL